MPDPSSAPTWLRPLRRRRAPRREVHRFVTHTEARLIVLSRLSAGRRGAPANLRSRVWTLYSRWEWAVATARAERVRRACRPPSHRRDAHRGPFA